MNGRKQKSVIGKQKSVGKTENRKQFSDFNHCCYFLTLNDNGGKMGREKIKREGDELEEDLVLLEKELKRGYRKSRKKRKKKWPKGW